jgi:thioredoxin-like negative regulator of GroEL
MPRGLFWIKTLILVLLAAGGWFWYRDYYGPGGWTEADAEPVDAATRAVPELTGASFDDFVAAGKSPALIIFYSPSCAYCRAAMSALERLSQQSNGRYRIGKLDVEAEGGTAQRYPIRGVPTFIFFSQGGPVDAITGVPAEDEEGIYQGMRGFIDKVLATTSAGHR